jgi:hypothetical protein
MFEKKNSMDRVMLIIANKYVGVLPIGYLFEVALLKSPKKIINKLKENRNSTGIKYKMVIII